VAAARKSLRVKGGSPIERLCDRGTPVHYQRFEFIVGDRESADAKNLTIGDLVIGMGVNATKTECLVANIELVKPRQTGANHDVTLGSRLKSSTLPKIENVSHHGVGFGTHDLKRGIGSVKEGLLLD
jgi:hypothetical protein